jgi:hypothetical protein
MDIVLYIDPEASQACALECLDSVSRTVDIAKHSVWVAHEGKLPYAVDLFTTERVAYVGWNTIALPKHADTDINHLSVMKHNTIAHIQARFVFRHPFWADIMEGVLQLDFYPLAAVGLTTEPIMDWVHSHLLLREWCQDRQTAVYLRRALNPKLVAFAKTRIPAGARTPEAALLALAADFTNNMAVLPTVEVDAWPW